MPSLTILAGPNGAGKTRNTAFLLSVDFLPSPPLDLDLLINEAIDDLPHSMYGADARLARTADRLFLSYCKEAIDSGNDFCYECNFRRDQLRYVGLFEEAGYKLNLIYFLLNSVEQSEQRVAYRVKNQNGRMVDYESIQENFIQGLLNLDNHFMDFQRVIIIDNSEDSYDSTDFSINIQLIIEGDKVITFNKDFPKNGLKSHLPKITALIQKQYNKTE